MSVYESMREDHPAVQTGNLVRQLSTYLFIITIININVIIIIETMENGQANK